MTAFPLRRVEDLAQYLTVGFVGSMADLFTEEGVPLLRGQNIKPYSLDLTNLKFITSETHKKWKKSALEAGDVAIVRVGYPGTACVIPPGLGPLNAASLVIVRPNTELLDAHYLAYVLNSPWGKATINGRLVGAAQQVFNTNTAADTQIPAPPVAIQRRIASILSAYDGLIENNTRRIAILEEMARRIYEEWFVRFRFPGHENVRMVESELGMVPEGWEPCPLGTLVEHHIGGGWGQEEAIEDFSVPAYVIRGTDIPDVRGGSLGRAPLRFHTPSNFRSRKLEARDIVFEVSGGSKDQPVGRAVMIPAALLSRTNDPIICASFCRLVRADSSQILPELLHLHFERIYASREIMKYQTQSTGITNFRFTVFLEKEVILKPTAEVQEQFAAVLLPMVELISSLGIKNSNLRTTRDLLLPKLISGELDVSALPDPASAVA